VITFKIQEFGENLQSISQKSEKIWLFRQVPRWPDLILARGQSILEKGQTKILGPASVIWDQIFEIWPQECQHANPGLKPFLTDHATACGVIGLTQR